MERRPRSTLAFPARLRRLTTPSPASSPRCGGRVAAGGFLLEPDACCFDGGYRRSVLPSPVLKRLADPAAGGPVAGGYVGSPNRGRSSSRGLRRVGTERPGDLCGARGKLGHLGEGVRPG